MAEYLVLRISDGIDAPAYWIAVDSDGRRLGPPVSGTLDEVAGDIHERIVIVLVPSADVLTTTTDIPIKGGDKLQAALPYALEESLADDVDKLHFAAGNRRSSGRVPVSVVDRGLLEGWLDRLQQAGIEPASMVAETYGLARIPGTISLLLAEDQVLVNDGADVEIVLQGFSPGDALATIGAFDDESDASDEDAAADDKGLSPLSMPKHVLVYCEAADEEKYQHDWIAMRHELGSLDIKLLADGVLPRLAATVATGAGINLLQGRFARKTDYSGLFQPWKYAAILLLALSTLMVGAKVVDIYNLKNQLSGIQQEFLVEYQQFVPGARLPSDPLPAVQSLLARTGSTESPQVFLQSLMQLSAAIQQNRSAAIEAISFRAGVVDVRLTAPDVSTLDNIQRAIGQSGQFSATIKSTDRDDDKVTSRIQIQAGGA